MNAVYFITALLFTFTTGQFAFPGDESEEEAINERKPLYIPGRCPEHQLLYPEDGKEDFTCDCGPGFIYHAGKDTCYEAYRQGPCKENEYYILKKITEAPLCVKNPCRSDSMVRYKGRCHKLNKSNGCPKKNDNMGVLGVNATTLELSCLYGDVSELNLIQVSACPPGSKRISTGACRKPY